ncbi:hypothetical protein LMG28688_05934 [Paraburkholderia caffeinitolerans]|uniref:Zinc finger/thioredoxin putative domain-containing protein n=1 Tax=Paraburkholderia caffeinitolerans TaxID=1723730 RepID=A0A6J5GPN6_9BURK|nr:MULTISPECIES: zinc-ribbon and DUF3426 domain-containing protein [Paraburkholderia]CAB3804205.1 hypothetical protein LMG28688_05934 [Paraburkholderia caffeinitolerans]
MLLATRCPFCETVFRIQPAHLAARRGLVRCGHCQEAFDASGSLYELPENGDFALATPVAADIAASLATPSAQQAAAAQAAQAPDHDQPPQAEPAAPSAQSAPPSGSPNFSGSAWDPWAPRPDSNLDPDLQYNGSHLPRASLAAGRGPNVRIVRDAEPTLSPGGGHGAAQAGASGHVEPTLSVNEAIHSPHADPEPVLRRAPAGSSAAPVFTALEPNAGGEPFAVTREAPTRAKRHTSWRIVGVLIALALLATLAAQLAWWMRETVMVYWPASQPYYQQACAQLGCQLRPPRDIDGLQVRPSDLRQVDDPHHLELKVPLHNRFDVALAWPAMELTLLDRQNNIVLRRVLFPQDYAPPGTHIEAGMAPHITQTMIVRLDTGNVVASNFRIEIFYP